MTKAQALLYCKEKAEYEGWMTHTFLLELWEEEEEIPDYVMELICYPPKPPEPFIIYMSPTMQKYFEMYLLQGFMAQEFIEDKTNKN